MKHFLPKTIMIRELEVFFTNGLKLIDYNDLPKMLLFAHICRNLKDQIRELI